MSSEAASASRHTALRWVGAPLFFLGIVGFVGAVALVATTDLRWTTILLYVGATGLSLGTFGTHNDTGLAMAFRARREELSPSLKAELEAELAADKRGVLALAVTPIAAWVVTLAALALHSVGAWRLVSVL
ncbi:MAG TPA: hypothetical protein QGF58_22675 [Myxococcota bacterium]|nr:hypothetical protein [Myxococcota bacterium]